MFGRKKKKDKDQEEQPKETPVMETTSESKPKERKLTPQEQEALGMFEEFGSSYTIFGVDSFGSVRADYVLCNLLFAVWCELRKLNTKLEEEGLEQE